MISRSTIFALVFACIATLSLAGVAKVHRVGPVETAKSAKMAVYQMTRVVVSGKIVAAPDQAPSGN